MNLEGKERRLLFVSTEPVAGVRRTIRVEPEAAMASIAQGLSAQLDALRPLLQERDPTIGEGAFQTSVERQIADAQRLSRSPWHFMFNLGSGHRRMKRELEMLDASPGRTDVLFAIAARQIAMRDTGCELPWLESTMRRYGVDPLTQTLKDIEARIPLVESHRGISTPHPQIATLVINERFRGAEAANRRAIFWALFDDDTVPIDGLASLISESRGLVVPFPDNLRERLVRRCLGSSSVGAAASLLARLLASCGLNPERLLGEQLLQNWLAAPDEEDAVGLESMVNELVNAAPRDARAVEVVSRVPAPLVAVWASAMTVPASWAKAGLLDRMGVGTPKDWRASVAQGLERDRLTEAIRSASGPHLHEASMMIVALAPFDEAFALSLVRELEPVIVGAMQKDVVRAQLATTDLFFRVLGLLPKFLRGEREPTPDQRAIARSIFDRVGARTFARQISTARRCDWHSWFNFVDLFLEVAPDIAEMAAPLVDLSALAAEAAPLVETSPNEIDDLLVALLWDRNHEPGRTLAERLFAGRSSLSWRAAYVAPPVAVEIVAKGGTLVLPMSGGLPNWGASAGILAALGDLDRSVAVSVLRQNVDALADGLLFRQSNGSTDLSTFLMVASALDEATLLAGVAKIDVSIAQDTWVQRCNGSDAERASMRAVLPLAMRANGGIMVLAVRLHPVAMSDDSPSRWCRGFLRLRSEMAILAITSVTPISAPTGGGLLVELVGAGFGLLMRRRRRDPPWPPPPPWASSSAADAPTPSKSTPPTA